MNVRSPLLRMTSWRLRTVGPPGTFEFTVRLCDALVLTMVLPATLVVGGRAAAFADALMAARAADVRSA